jgi:methyl-accepting chemotaxis protein
MFRKWKLGQKLVGAFVLAALITVIVGLIALKGLGDTEEVLTDIGSTHLPGVEAVTNMKVAMYKILASQRGLMNAAMTGSAYRKEQFELMDDGWKLAAKARAIYEPLPREGEEAAVWNEYVSQWELWKSKQDVVRHIEEEKDRLLAGGARPGDPAIKKLDGQALKAAADARGAFQPLQAKLSRLAEINTSVADNDYRYAKKVARAIMMMMPFVMVLAMLVAIGLGLWISRSITRPVQQALTMITEMEKGHLGTRLALDSHDEIGQMAQVLNSFADELQLVIIKGMKMIAQGDLSQQVAVRDGEDEINPALIHTIASLRDLIDDTDMLSRSATQGYLDKRADVSRYRGDFRKILEGVNETVRTLSGFIDIMPAPALIVDKELRIRYINRKGAELIGVPGSQIVGTTCDNHFRNPECKSERCAVCKSMQIGETSTSETKLDVNGRSIEISYTGVPIKDQEGRVLGALELITDLTDVKQSARRAQKMSEYQAHEVRKLTECLDRMARGDLAFTLEVAECEDKGCEVRKNFLAISSALNNCTSAIKSLVSDAHMLSQSAVDGKLGVRADEARHQGDFRSIVRGVNDTLDAVIGPVNEAAQVMQQVADRDLTARVRGEYRGDLAQLKEAINQAIENLDSGLGRVNLAAEQVASVSEEIGKGSQEVAQGASEQASSLEEISSSLQQMSSMTKQTAGNSKEARGITESAHHATERGVESMNRLSEAVKAIKNSSDQTARILKTIDEIAFQTNLLALNAAVEAARAGEAGKGFAVVAEEVRNLAMRSASAAKNTAQMIEESLRNADNGVTLNGEVLQNLIEINTQVSRVSEMMGQIMTASEQQSSGIEQINLSVEQMNQLTQQNAANSEESASASQELGSQAQEMRKLVSAFRLSAAGSRNGTKATGAGGRMKAHTQDTAYMKDPRGNGNAGRPKAVPQSFITLDDSEAAALLKF